MPRDFLFGMIRVPMWDYYWGLTAAQVELLSIDQPIVVYKADQNKEKPWKDGKVSESYAQKAYRKWLEGKKKREKEGSEIDIQKVMTEGKKVDFGKYLETGEKKELESN